MSEGAGVMRSEESLQATLTTLDQLGTQLSSEPRIEAWEASNLYLLAEAIVRGALARTESRGSHWRTDFPLTDTACENRVVQKYDQKGRWSTTLSEVKK